MKVLNALIFILIIVSSSVWGSTKKINNWYENFVLKDPSFNFEFIRTLGYTYEKGADIGESVSTAEEVIDGDFDSWYTAWLKTANRLNKIGEEAYKNGHQVTAKEAFFRASNYYRSAGFYMVSEKNRSKSIKTNSESKKSFLKAIKSLSYVVEVKIPYQETSLPGYLIKADKPNAPIVIVNSGFDGTAEELFFEVGSALHARGFNALLVEGPGQGGVLRQQNIPFRYDWEKVVTPIINYIETLSDVNKDKIALLGISMGGYLAPRAAAYEPRIKALIANGGVYDFASAIYNTLPKELIDLVNKDPDAFNAAIKEQMKKSSIARWFFQNGMWTFHAATPADFIKKVKPYTLKGIAKKIKMPTLVVDSEEDGFMQGQAKALYNHISGPKDYLLFTKKESAQAHCQMGAIAISNERILDWLDNVFR